MAESDDYYADKILFDLRQTYAMKILTPILEMIEMYRMENKFEKWFDCLTMHLYTNVHQKMGDDEVKEYNEKLKGTIRVLNQYPDTFAGRDNSNEKIFKVKYAIQQLEIFLKKIMEANGLYGKGSEYDWDEI